MNSINMKNLALFRRLSAMNNFKLRSRSAMLLLIGLIAFSGVGLLVRQSTAADDKKAAAKPALTVTAVQPTRSSLPVKLRANGNIAAWQEAIIGSESPGLRLAEVRVNVGDQVKVGEVLAVFDATTVQAELAQARAGLQEAEANAAEALANANRARSLQTSGALSAQQISQYLTAELIAQAKLASAKANLNAVQLRLAHTQVVAPDSGLISSRSATVGAVGGQGMELFRMVRRGRLEWRAELAAQELASIRRGAEVRVTATNGAQVKGHVRAIAPTVDAQTRNALVYVDLSNGADKLAPLKAGMFASGEFVLGSSNALTVPSQSVVVRDGFSYVFVVQADQRVSQRRVSVGRRLADSIEIIDGVTADSVLVANGAGFLNDGDLIKRVTAAAK